MEVINPCDNIMSVLVENNCGLDNVWSCCEPAIANNKGRCKTIPFYTIVIGEQSLWLSVVIAMHVYNAGALSSAPIGAEEGS